MPWWGLASHFVLPSGMLKCFRRDGEFFGGPVCAYVEIAEYCGTVRPLRKHAGVDHANDSRVGGDTGLENGSAFECVRFGCGLSPRCRKLRRVRRYGEILARCTVHGARCTLFDEFVVDCCTRQAVSSDSSAADRRRSPTFALCACGVGCAAVRPEPDPVAVGSDDDDGGCRGVVLWALG